MQFITEAGIWSRGQCGGLQSKYRNSPKWSGGNAAAMKNAVGQASAGFSLRGTSSPAQTLAPHQGDMFDELIGSVREAGAILRGQKQPSRRISVGASGVREIRE